MPSIFSYVSGLSVCPPWTSVNSGPLPIFSLGCLSSWSGVVWFLYIFWRSNPCLKYHWQLYFPISWFPFHFSDIFFSHIEVFQFDVVPFVYSFLFIPWSVEYIGENIAAWNIWDFPMFFSRTFMVSWLIFKSFVHLEFIFVYGVTWSSSFIFFACSCPDLPTPFVEEAIFAPPYGFLN